MKSVFANRTATIIIVVLVILNLASLYFFVIHRKLTHRHHWHKKGTEHHEKMEKWRKDGKGEPHFLERELEFSEEQRAQFRSIRKGHFESMHKKKKEIREIREVLFKNPSDSINADSLSLKIGQLQSELDFSMRQHFKSLREICTEEQLPKFDKIMNRIVQRILDMDDWSKKRKMHEKKEAKK